MRSGEPLGVASGFVKDALIDKSRPSFEVGAERETLLMLRHPADRRSIGYLLFMLFLAALQWNVTGFRPAIYAFYLFMAVTVAVISHNHNHLSIWKVRGLNLLTSYMISIHYGHPAKLPKLHAEHAHKIHPWLLQRSWWRFMFWTFILRPFVPGAKAVNLSDEVGACNAPSPVAPSAGT
jgi:hypothetical protein